MSRRLLRGIDERIEEEIREISETLVSGRCESYEQYKNLCGRVRGLRMAQDINKQALQRINEDDDE